MLVLPVQEKRRIKLFMQLAHEENKCVIIVTHDQHIAGIADQTIRLSKGQITIVNNISEYSHQ